MGSASGEMAEPFFVRLSKTESFRSSCGFPEDSTMLYRGLIMQALAIPYALLPLVSVMGQLDNSPYPPWLSLVVQGGSFALVVVIVCYLYPKLAREAREDQQTREKNWRDLIQVMQLSFNERNDKVTSAFDKQTEALAASFDKAAGRIEHAVVGVCKNKPS